jgi:hypothetical protein
MPAEESTVSAPMRRLDVLVEEASYQQLVLRAKAQGLTVSALTRLYIARALEHNTGALDAGRVGPSVQGRGPSDAALQQSLFAPESPALQATLARLELLCAATFSAAARAAAASQESSGPSFESYGKSVRTALEGTSDILRMKVFAQIANANAHARAEG